MPTQTSTSPPASLSEHAELLRAEFGIEGEMVPLSADRGATYAVVQNGAPTHVVKIGLAPTEADRARLDLQAEFLRWARGTLGAVQVPLPVADRQGRGWHPHPSPDGSVTAVQVTTWVPGDPLSRCRARTPPLLRSAGRALASATLAMAGMPDSPGSGPDGASPQEPFAWDLLHTGWIVPELERSPDPALREFVPIARRFMESTLPAVTRLPQQLLHNDWNDDNILVTGPHDAPQVTGLIDFGDMVRGPAVVELGVGLAYLMLDCSDPLAAACHVIAGYSELRPSPLADEELNLLWDLVRMRWALSAVHAASRRSGLAGNDHHQVSQAPIRRAFEATRSLPDGVALAAFRRAAGLPPVPHRDAVLAHLRNAALEGQLVPVMGNLGGAPVLDLSASSPEAGPGAALDVATFTRWIDAQCATHPSGAAIGRWNEPRLLYQSRGFGEAGATGGSARTIHIGLDIFAAEGTLVRAPLDGVVFTVADNAGELDYGPTVVLQHETPEGHRFHTLYGHLSRSCLTELAPGTVLRAGTPFATIGGYAVNGGWPPHLHLQLILTDPDPSGDYLGVAPPDWRTLWTAICPNPAVLAGLEEESVAAQTLDVPALVERRQRLTGANLSLSYAESLVIVRGEGQYLYDHEGRRFLDGVNNVAHVGHGHRRVVAALRGQAAVLNTNTRYLHPRFLEYTERLTALFPDPLKVCFLVNSGSEANELALRLARAATGRRGVVAMRDGYHGNTGALVDISGYKHLGPGGQGTPSHVRLLATPAAGTGGVPDVAGEMGRACVELDENGTPVGAFICEPILSCAGQVVLPAGYLKAACAAARSAGALCVIDEVQTGLGRVGTAWWAFEEQGIVPDIVTLGKPLGNGHPMGAVITTRAIADAFANGMEYFNTFGGNPVSCAVGLAVLDVIEEEGLRARAVQLGARLQKGLLELAENHPLIGEVRGRGLFLGVECVDGTADRAPAPRQARHLVERMKEEGVLLSTDGPHHNVIKIKPPLVLEERDLERMVESMGRALGSLKFEV